MNVRTLIISALFSAGIFVAVPVFAADRVVLITAAEAAKPNQKIMKGMRTPPEPSDGPILEFVTPKDGATVGKPVPIEVNFKAKDAPVQIESLEVTYLKLFSIDITDRIRPYATADGIHIKEADLPAGTHRVKFSLKDTEDRLTERTLSVTIE